MPVLTVSEVVVRYGSTAALNGVSFTVEPGEVVALLGPNGAGKTTLLETIEGYRTPDSGSVSVFDLNPATHRTDISPRWGVMPQVNGLPMGLTVGEAIALFAGLYESSTSPTDLANAVGLGELTNRKWRGLSGGEQQRLSLALALAGGNELLLLDEPTAAVDQVGRERILEMIRARSAAGAAVLLTTHRFDDVEATADRVIVLDHGMVVGSGTLTELTSVDNVITFRATPELSLDGLTAALDSPIVEIHPGQYQLQREPTAANVADLAKALAELDIPIDALDAGRTSVESVFRRLTSGDDA